jgi:hypothetical protein
LYVSLPTLEKDIGEQTIAPEDPESIKTQDLFAKI